MADKDDDGPINRSMAHALKPNMLRRAEHERGAFFAIVPSDTTFEQVMTPSYWQHHVAMLAGGQTLRPFARVEVVREDGTMDLDLRVVATKPGMVKMNCLRKYVEKGTVKPDPIGDADAPLKPSDLPEGYKYAHVPHGANRGHMIRLSNGDVLVQGKATAAEAVAAAWAHFKEASSPNI